jgi:hypothetical protein
MSKPEWRHVEVTRRQADAMAAALWTQEQRVRLYAEIANVDYRPTVKDQIALMEIRRRLIVASEPDSPEGER